MGGELVRPEKSGKFEDTRIPRFQSWGVCQIYEIVPAVKYTSADLNWNNPKSRSSVEMKDKSSRPELADRKADISGHDVIFLGFPIWWYVAPTIINTFLESYDFSGKKIILFATSGGSGFGRAVEGLKPSAPDAEIREGKLFRSSVSVNELKKWADSLGI
ncbi:MAG: NAD(P)H-dependent oxidoreductase [Synergistaceae bacterium]|nr:NAD(P)H-dependent oxidoreductase [Synergistaceae bacterium]